MAKTDSRRGDLGLIRAQTGSTRGDLGLTRAKTGSTRGDLGLKKAKTGSTRGDLGLTRAKTAQNVKFAYIEALRISFISARSEHEVTLKAAKIYEGRTISCQRIFCCHYSATWPSSYQVER